MASSIKYAYYFRNLLNNHINLFLPFHFRSSDITTPRNLVSRTRCNATPLIVIISVAIWNLRLENIMKHVLFRFKERRFAENHSLILCSLAFKVFDNKKGQ